jgi:ABC-type uncharacterized transport system substrate-binding protein
MNNIKRIVAVAVGPQAIDHPISATSVPSGVRPYIDGLMEGLAKRGYQPGTHYRIDYRERPQPGLAKGNDTFASKGQAPYDLIFAMSTTVVRAAKDAAKSTPIVGVVSDPKAEGFSRARNVTGISARRSQSAGQCFEHFLATVPTLKQVHVLHKPGYGPSDRGLKLVKAAAKKRGVTVKTATINYNADIQKKLSAMAMRNPKKPAEAGVLVLPVDVFLGAAQLIIDLAQGEKNLPTFFPVTDFVKPNSDGALGGYGVPQRTCGVLMAHYVDRILWHSAQPSSLKVTEAGAGDFEWVISSEAASALNIQVPKVI